MLPSSVNTQRFGKIATYLFYDLAKNNDYVYMKRGMTFCDLDDIPQFLVIVYGRLNKDPNLFYIEQKASDAKCYKERLNEIILENLPQICGDLSENIQSQLFDHIHISEKDKCEDVAKLVQSLVVEDKPHKMNIVNPLQCVAISNAISLNSGKFLKEMQIDNINLLDFEFQGMKLQTMTAVVPLSIDEQKYITVNLRHPNVLDFTSLVRTKKELGLFLVRKVKIKSFIKVCCEMDTIAKSISEMTPNTRYLIDESCLFEDACKARRTVHEVVNDAFFGTCNWLQSSRATNLLSEFKSCNDRDSIDSTVRIICGASSCGKTMYLRKLQNQLQESDTARWIEFIDGNILGEILDEHPKFFEEPTLQILHYLFRAETKFEQFLLQHCIKIYGRAVLLIDNLDDISKEYFIHASIFLENVRKDYPNIIIWVTTRPTLKNIILNHVAVFEYILSNLQETQEQDLLSMLLPNFDDKTIMNILNRIRYDNQSMDGYARNPYNLWLCSEKIKEMGKDTSFYCLEVYDYYIKKKLKSHPKIVMTDLFISAAYHFGKTEPTMTSQINASSDFEQVFGKFKDRCIIEYLTATFLANNPHYLNEELLLSSDVSYVMDLFDHVMFRQSKLGLTVLNKDLNKLMELSKKHDVKTEIDMLGRNLLHILKPGDKDIVEFLLQKGISLTDTDDILDWTPIQYYNKRKAYDCLEAIMEIKGRSKDICNIDHIHSIELPKLFEDCFFQKQSQICELIVESRRDFHVAPSTIYYISGPTQNIPKELILKVLSLAVTQKMYNTPAYLDYYGGTAVHCAARNNKDNIDIMTILLDELNYNVNQKSFDGVVPIMNATKIEMISYLIEKGADPNHIAKNRKPRTLFTQLCMRGYLDVVKYMVETIDGNFRDECPKPDCAPLYYATSSGNVELVQYLIDQKFPAINEPCSRGETPLHVACRMNNLALVKCLIGAKADVNKSTILGKPIEYLYPDLNLGNMAIYEYLIEHGSTYTIGQLFQLSTVWSVDELKEATKKYKADFKDVSSCGQTLLHYVSQWSKDKAVIKYVASNSELETHNAMGATALHLAFEKGNEVAIKVLLKMGANVHAKSKFGKTVLHFAMYNLNENILRIILEYKVDVNAKDVEGKSAVHFFMRTCTEKMAQMMTRHGLDVNSQDNDGQTALHSVGQNNQLLQGYSLEDYLRYLNIDSNIRDNRGRIFLHYAVENKNILFIRSLSKYQVLDIDAADKESNTPLMLAKRLGNQQIHKLLFNIKKVQSKLD